MTFAEIGHALGVNASRAHALVSRGLARTRQEPADELRRLEAERLDLMQLEAMRVLRRAHVIVSHGRVVMDDDGNPLIDDGPTLAAIGQLLRIQDRRAKLFGLDAPTKHEVLTLDAIDAEIRALEQQLGRSAAGAPAASADTED